MNKEVLKELARELATRVNSLVDIPFIKEDDEQAFFEMIILILLELVFNRLGFRSFAGLSPRV